MDADLERRSGGAFDVDLVCEVSANKDALEGVVRWPLGREIGIEESPGAAVPWAIGVATLAIAGQKTLKLAGIIPSA
jgi:hypothetical protein